MSRKDERRRHLRVTLQPPLVGSVGRSAVMVMDASVGGFRVAHHSNLPSPGGHCRIEIRSARVSVTCDCVVVRTIEQRTALSSPRAELFQSGLRIESCDERSRKRLEAIARRD